MPVQGLLIIMGLAVRVIGHFYILHTYLYINYLKLANESKDSV